jgi:hypothetical protein
MATRSRLEDVLDLLSTEASELLPTALLGKLSCVSTAIAGAVLRNLCWEGKFRLATQRAKYNTHGEVFFPWHFTVCSIFTWSGEESLPAYFSQPNTEVIARVGWMQIFKSLASIACVRCCTPCVEVQPYLTRVDRLFSCRQAGCAVPRTPWGVLGHVGLTKLVNTISLTQS